MDHDLTVGQGDALTLGTGGEQECAHAGGHADADGGDVALDEVHGVVDRHTGRNRATGAVDIERNILVGILGLQEQELRDHQGSGGVIDLVRQENDAVVEKTGEDVIGTLAPVGLLNNRGNQSGAGHTRQMQIVHHNEYLTFFHRLGYVAMDLREPRSPQNGQIGEKCCRGWRKADRGNRNVKARRARPKKDRGVYCAEITRRKRRRWP